jgi:hypothetical protein
MIVAGWKPGIACRGRNPIERHRDPPRMKSGAGYLGSRRNPETCARSKSPWIPAYAGMTNKTRRWRDGDGLSCIEPRKKNG